MDLSALARKSLQYRRTILRIICQAQAGHTGGDLSCIDVLNVLYNQVMDITPQNWDAPDRDHFIQSKGHAVEALYTVLADKGFFPAAALDTLCCGGSAWVGHPTRHVPGIEHNTGALGHGLPVSVGLALAGKLDGRAGRVFVLLGDGELAEGSCWEALMAASHHRLDNLVVIVDRNRLQISGRTEEVMALEPLGQKLAAFGCAVRECDGNDLRELAGVLAGLPFAPGQPSLLLAHTVKGKGVSFMEDRPEWHHHVPTPQELAAALAELDAAEAAL